MEEMLRGEPCSPGVSCMNFRNVIILSAIFASPVFAGSTVDHSLFDKLLKEHVVRGVVDYSAIKNDQMFAEYLKLLSAVDPSSIAEERERLAFWINAYNAFTIKLVVDHFPIKSIRDIKEGDTGPWDIVWISIHGKKYSLNVIEHEVIRKAFDEPRIHMALVCAAVSCPPLRSGAYTGEQLDKQLRENTSAFVRDKSKNRYDEKSNTLFLSELFQWYGGDFVKQYGSAENFVMKALAIKPATPPTITYLPYDWSLNSKR